MCSSDLVYADINQADDTKLSLVHKLYVLSVLRMKYVKMILAWGHHNSYVTYAMMSDVTFCSKYDGLKQRWPHLRELYNSMLSSFLSMLVSLYDS